MNTCGLRYILVALKQSTNPDSANESSASSTHLDSTLASSTQALPNAFGLTAASNGSLTPSASGVAMANGAQGSILGSGMNYDSTYDLWDPQHWMLDGLLDFNYTFAPAIEGA
jgi:hypothetical protein